MGDWIFGCDVCQEVCPWNGAPEPADQAELQTPPERRGLTLAALATLSIESYQTLFRGSPMKRAKLAGLQRNAAVAGGAAGG
jgi:epoxyqueuosine reductase